MIAGAKRGFVPTRQTRQAERITESSFAQLTSSAGNTLNRMPDCAS
jgi:hypothetical protein